MQTEKVRLRAGHQQDEHPGAVHLLDRNWGAFQFLASAFSQCSAAVENDQLL